MCGKMWKIERRQLNTRKKNKKGTAKKKKRKRIGQKHKETLY